MVHTLGAARGETSRRTKSNRGGVRHWRNQCPFPGTPNGRTSRTVWPVIVVTKEIEELHRVRGKVDKSSRAWPTNGTAVKGTLPILASSQLCRA